MADINQNNDPNRDQNKKKNTERFQFKKDHRYMLISAYVLLVIILGSVFIAMLLNLDSIVEGVRFLASALKPFIAAFFIAYFLNPLVKTIDRRILIRFFKIRSKKIRNIISILIAYILFVGTLVLILAFIIPQLFDSISELTQKIPAIYEVVLKWLSNIEKRLPSIDWSVVEDQIKNSMPQIMELSTSLLTDVFPKLINFSISLVSLVINILLSIVISVYMIADKYKLSDNATKIVYAILPKEKARSFIGTVKDCNSIFSAFVIGKAIDSLIIGLLCFIIMNILGLSYALLISVIVGVTNMIPYFGPFIGAIPSIIILLIIEPVQAIAFTILIFILQQFDGLYLGPKILGQSVGLKPLWVIFGITVGGAYGGFLGMFLGVPIVAVVAYLLNIAIAAGLKRHEITEDDIPKLS